MHASLASHAARDFDHNPIDHANRLEKELQQTYSQLVDRNAQIVHMWQEIDGLRDRVEALSLDLGIYDTIA